MKNSNTECTNIQSNNKSTSPSVPMFLKLVSGEEIIVTTLVRTPSGDSYIITNPYIVMRQIVNNMPHLYLMKWISYSESDAYIINRNTVILLGLPNKEVLSHYNTCLEEEFMNEHGHKVTTNQISFTQH